MDGNRSVKRQDEPSGQGQVRRSTLPVSPARRITPAALLGLAGLVFSWIFGNGGRPPPEPLPRRLSDAVGHGSPSAPAAPSAPPSSVDLPRDIDARVTSAVASAPPAAAFDETRHPHPITPAHRRIFEENNRIGALNGAMDQGDFVALRRLNAEYRRAYPEDENVLQEGYELIADCLEERTPRAVDAARRFWQTHRASALRRHVRRHCLEEYQGR
jgi:hypothetical protein